MVAWIDWIVSDWMPWSLRGISSSNRVTNANWTECAVDETSLFSNESFDETIKPSHYAWKYVLPSHSLNTCWENIFRIVRREPFGIASVRFTKRRCACCCKDYWSKAFLFKVSTCSETKNRTDGRTDGIKGIGHLKFRKYHTNSKRYRTENIETVQ